jgi:hypothetical protein
VPHERPPYERGKADEAALEHMAERITNPRTRAEKEHWERILGSVRGMPWWRRMLGLSLQKITLAEPTEPEPVPPQNVGDEGFFAARPEEIDDDTVENGPYRFAVVGWKWMDPVTLGTLGEIVGAGTYDELADQMLADMRGAASGEAGLFQLPEAMRDALTAVEDPVAPATRWLETDELRLDEWTLDEARDLIQQVRELARRATADERHVYVWWSL